jgi:TPR repeat protein/CHAT domain-containing protein
LRSLSVIIYNNFIAVLTVTTTLVQLIFSSPAYPADNPPIHDCDQLAAFPGYEGSSTLGVVWEKMDAVSAIKECQIANKMYPGNARFQYQLGRAFLKSSYYENALPLLKASAEQGFIPAYLAIGVIYANGWGLPIDKKQAFEWTKKAADTEFPIAQATLAEMYYLGAGVKKDYHMAFSLLSSAAAKGNSQAEYILSLLYSRGHGVDQDYTIASQWLSRAAKNNHLQAQNDLAHYLFNGIGVAQNKEAAVKWFKTAAEFGHAPAQANLGLVLSGRLDYPAEHSEAFKWTRRAAEQGNVQAQADLGFIYQEGIGAEQDFEEAVVWYLKAAERGFAFAQVKLGLLSLNGSGVEKNLEKAASLFRQAAEQGDVDASYFLASAYYHGNGVTKDLTEAVAWYEKAAEQGDSYSQFRVASMYLNGDGIPKNFTRGLRWLKKAAKNNETIAQRELGDVFRHGAGVPKNVTVAIKWYQKAADSGDMNAITKIAEVYFAGDDVAKDDAKAFELYLKAARGGDANAQSNVGSLFLNGIGTEKNFIKAREWSLKAALKGDAFAQSNLGHIYLVGAGVNKNFEEAHKWFSKASQKNNVHSLVSIAHMYSNGYGIKQSYQKAVEHLFKAGNIALSNDKYDGAAGADILKRLASIYEQTGRYYLAEDLAKNLLVTWEQVKGPQDEKVADVLILLAGIYYRQGRNLEAKRLFHRIFKILSGDTLEIKRNRLIAIRILAKIYYDENKLSEAEELYLKALKDFETIAAVDQDYGVGFLSDYGNLLVKMGRYDQAKNMFERTKSAVQNQYGKDHPFNVNPLSDLANLYRHMGNLEKAEQLFQQAVKFVGELGIEEHPLVALGLADFSAVYEAKGDTKKALNTIRQAVRLYLRRLNRTRGALSRGVSTERRVVRRVFVKHADLAFQESNKQVPLDEQLIQEAFMAGQFATYVSAGEAISRMTARFSTNDVELSSLIRQRQDAQERWNHLDREFLFDSNLTTKMSLDDNGLIRKELQTLKSLIYDLDSQIAKTHPEFANLTTSKATSFVDVRKVLRPDEALIKWTVGEEKSYLWVVTVQSAKMFKLNVGGDFLMKSVSNLRESLDPTGVVNLSDIRPFNLAKAFELYQEFFAPAEILLEGIRHVFVVPDGALQSLPIGVLITQKQQEKFIGFSDYKKVSWLAKKYALSTLPSVSSLYALRTFAKAKSANKPFVGFGDPLLKGHPEVKDLKLASLYKSRGVGDVNAVRSQLSPLPETSDELKSMAKILGASNDNLFLKDNATERNAKTLDLSDYRILAFATHGLVSGDLKGLAEPALVLTPPETGTEEDDGLLTASEVATLKLNSDLVVLSACNTASNDGTPGAEALSGLAKAFFYAGSRALLVSHWLTESRASSMLTTGMFKEAANDDKIGWAEALRRSIRAMIQSSEKPYYSHPLFWAPFVVVGEGGTY